MTMPMMAPTLKAGSTGLGSGAGWGSGTAVVVVGGVAVVVVGVVVGNVEFFFS